MSEMHWTPGPWVRVALRGPKRWSIETNDAYPIAELRNYSTDNGNADSQLIRHAPDLYAALSGLLDAILTEPTDVAAVHDATRNAYAVLALARGDRP
jgi:hypothetical protein